MAPQLDDIYAQIDANTLTENKFKVVYLNESFMLLSKLTSDYRREMIINATTKTTANGRHNRLNKF